MASNFDAWLGGEVQEERVFRFSLLAVGKDSCLRPFVSLKVRCLT